MKTALPPGPRLPSALQTVGWTQRTLPFLERCHRRYGDAFTLRIRNWGDWVVLADPDDAKRVFTAKAVGVAAANPLLGPVLGHRSVMLLEEPEHLVRRKLILPAFHGKSLEADREMIAEVARRELSDWPTGEPFALWPRMQSISVEVVMQAVFGHGADRQLKEMRRRLDALTAWLNDSRNLMMIAALGPRVMAVSRTYRKVMGTVESAVMEEVERRRSQPSREDIVAMLMEARYEDGEPMLTAGALRDELVTLLTDGPTSTSLAWAFDRLLREPAKLERAQADAEGGDGAYLDAIVKETLRLRTPIPVVVRRLTAPMEVAGHVLPAGTVVAPCVHLIHRNERIYPEPERFRPERFLERPAGTYTWIPFGGGVRRCLAASFAELEMKQVLKEILGNVRLRTYDDRSERVRKAAISFAPSQSGLVIAE